MAATKQIDAMTAATALGGTEEIPAVQSAATVKITADQIKTFTSASPTLVTPVLGVASGTSLTLSNGTSIAPVLVGGQATSGLYFGNTGYDLGYVRAGAAQSLLGFQKIAQMSGGVFGWAPSTDPSATMDTGLSRISAGVIGVGTGAQGSVAGGLQAATLALGGATIGANALAVTGNANISGSLTLSNTLSMTDANITRVSGLYFGSAIDTILTRGGAAATLQHGAADAASPVAQTIKFQDVVAGTSNTAGVNATIQAPAGTGTGAGGSLIFQVAPAGSSGTAKNAWATALTIDSNKLATFAAGANFAAQVNNTGEFISTITGGGFRASASGWLYWNGKSVLSSPSDGVITVTNQAITDFTRLQFGGTTSSFPALKRSTTTLQVRLADDSAFTAIQGKLTTDTAYVATPQVPTGYITIYDSTGTAYKVSVNP